MAKDIGATRLKELKAEVAALPDEKDGIKLAGAKRTLLLNLDHAANSARILAKLLD